MAYTGHGHHIPGTLRTGTPPKQRSRCGDFSRCRDCQLDQLKALFKDFTEYLAVLYPETSEFPDALGYLERARRSAEFIINNRYDVY